DPARGRPRQHRVGLAPVERAVDQHDQERVHESRVAGRDEAEPRLQQQRHQQGAERQGQPHRTERSSAGFSALRRTTMTSSSFSRRAEGTTTTSLNRADGAATDRTRPRTRPFGKIPSSPDVTTTSPTATSARAGTYF